MRVEVVQQFRKRIFWGDTESPKQDAHWANNIEDHQENQTAIYK